MPEELAYAIVLRPGTELNCQHINKTTIVYRFLQGGYRVPSPPPHVSSTINIQSGFSIMGIIA